MAKTPAQTVSVLRNLLADLFSETTSRLGDMGSDSVTPDLIPADLKFEKQVLEAFYLAEEKGLPPNVDNITLLCRSNDQNLREKIEKLAGEASSVPLIRAGAIWFTSWVKQELLSEAAKEVMRVAGMDYGDVGEKRDRMLDSLINLPIADVQQSYNRVELMEMFQDVQRKRVERAQQGQALGAVLHLAALREAAPVLTPGDLTLITAAPKAGKTGSVMEIAEYNALENDTDVLVLLLETSPTTIEERFLARDLLIPGKALRDGKVNLHKPPFEAPYRAYLEEQRQHWNTCGRMYFEYIAGSKLSEITTKIRIHKRMADARNRPLLVIIDYLQRITKASNKSDVEAIALISNYIKDIAVRYECHIILLSQESFTGANREQGDSRAHGSNTPIFVAQIHIALRVLNATKSVLFTDENGVPFKDALGRDRSWQTEGKQKRQSVIRYDILRANDNDTTQAYALVENAFFIMTDISKAATWELPLFAQEQVKSFDEDLKDASRRLI